MNKHQKEMNVVDRLLLQEPYKEAYQYFVYYLNPNSNVLNHQNHKFLDLNHHPKECFLISNHNE